MELPIEEILSAPEPATSTWSVLGRSRQGRPILGGRFGGGGVRVSLIGGCHADEPVGPAMLLRLGGWLARLPSRHAARSACTWSVVPHANPDGAARNAAWSDTTVAVTDSMGESDRGYDVAAYLHGAVRELPGDDVEFGFPRADDDLEARPENRAVARFLAEGGPLDLHGSFHGMAFAPGPWFLIEAAWAERTRGLRDSLRRRVQAMGYAPFDVDRGGEKGFHRIDEGFSTRPDSGAMRAHFEALGDPGTAALFRPSSMEYARSLGGDPFTFVSEMPLFLVSEAGAAPGVGRDDGGRRRFSAWLAELAAGRSEHEVRRAASGAGIRPMPIRDQMRLQLAFLDEALAAVTPEAR